MSGKRSRSDARPGLTRKAAKAYMWSVVRDHYDGFVVDAMALSGACALQFAVPPGGRKLQGWADTIAARYIEIVSEGDVAEHLAAVAIARNELAGDPPTARRGS